MASPRRIAVWSACEPLSPTALQGHQLAARGSKKARRRAPRRGCCSGTPGDPGVGLERDGEYRRRPRGGPGLLGGGPGLGDGGCSRCRAARNSWRPAVHPACPAPPRPWSRPAGRRHAGLAAPRCGGRTGRAPRARRRFPRRPRRQQAGRVEPVDASGLGDRVAGRLVLGRLGLVVAQANRARGPVQEPLLGAPCPGGSVVCSVTTASSQPIGESVAEPRIASRASASAPVTSL